MKRTMVVMAVAALLVAGSALADDGGLIGSGTRSQVMGSGGRTGDVTTQDTGGLIGSGTRSEASGQYFGSGGRADGGYFGSGLRAALYLLFGI